MAAIMASTYKAYLGVGLGPLSVRMVAFAYSEHGTEQGFLKLIELCEICVCSS